MCLFFEFRKNVIQAHPDKSNVLLMHIVRVASRAGHCRRTVQLSVTVIRITGRFRMPSIAPLYSMVDGYSVAVAES